jgi:hypothetical protein
LRSTPTTATPTADNPRGANTPLAAPLYPDQPDNKIDFPGFTLPDTPVLPSEFRALLSQIDTLAELKLTLAALMAATTPGHTGALSPIRHLAKVLHLSPSSIQRALTRAVARGTIIKDGDHYLLCTQVGHSVVVDTDPSYILQDNNNTQILNTLTTLGVSPQVALRLTQEFDEAYLLRHITALKKQRQLRSPAGWLLCSIRQNWTQGTLPATNWYDGNEHLVQK